MAPMTAFDALVGAGWEQLPTEATAAGVVRPCPAWCERTITHDPDTDYAAGGIREHVRIVWAAKPRGRRNPVSVNVVQCDDLATGRRGPARVSVNIDDEIAPALARTIATVLVSAAHHAEQANR